MYLQLQQVKATTELCRYCLMCRHTCPVTAITANEATSPHGWGMLVASVERGLISWNDETVDVLYQCADCGLCRAHCVTDQPLPLAINASRAEVVALKKAPAIVYELEQKLKQWGNLYAEVEPVSATEQSEAVLIVGAVGQHLQPQIVSAAQKLLSAVGVLTLPISAGRENPHTALTLGLEETAHTLATATLNEIKATGAKQVFVLSPADMYAYQTTLPYLDLSWPENVELIDLATFLANQLDNDRLSFTIQALQNYTYYDSDQSVKIPDYWRPPRKLLSALGLTAPIELFWRKERAAPCGISGGLPFTQPSLSKQLAQARLNEAAQRGISTLITADPHATHHLQQMSEANNSLTISNLFELLAANLSS